MAESTTKMLLSSATNTTAATIISRDIEPLIRPLSSAVELLTLFLYHPLEFLQMAITSLITFACNLPPTVRILLAIYFMFLFTTNVQKSYRSYLSLGLGGTPPNIWGWWRVTRLKYVAALPSVLIPPHIPPTLNPYRGIVCDLPPRSGVRPVVKGIAPQRQSTQKAPFSTYMTLSRVLESIAAANPKHLSYAPRSFLEGHTPALFALPTPFSAARPETAEFGYEIAHPHCHDGSVHMIMHPEDVRTVIEAGWGERHPLARRDWWWVGWYHCVRRRRAPVPETLVFVYCPRNETEMAIVTTLIKASAWWISGVEIQ